MLDTIISFMSTRTENDVTIFSEIKNFFSEFLDRVDTIIDLLKTKKSTDDKDDFEDEDISLLASNDPKDQKKIINFIFE